MSLPSTLQGTHDECGGTVVFRPATHRRALLAGERVDLHAACRTCGETLTIAWALADWHSPALSIVEDEVVQEIDRASEEERVSLALAAGAESWTAPAQARAATPADHMPLLAPSAEHPAPALAGVSDRAELDAFMGRFAERVARARTSLERVRTELPTVLADESLRAPVLRRAAAAVPTSVVQPPSEPAAVEPPSVDPPQMVLAPEPSLVEPELPPIRIAPDPTPVVAETLPAMQLDPPAATTAPVPLHERTVLASTDDDVLGGHAAPPVVEVAPPADLAPLTDLARTPAAQVEAVTPSAPEPVAPVVTPPAAAADTSRELFAWEVPAESAAASAGGAEPLEAAEVDVHADDDATIDAASEVEVGAAIGAHDGLDRQEHRAQRRRAKARARAQVRRTGRSRRRPARSNGADADAAMADVILDDADARAPRIHMALPEIAIIVLLAAVSGIAFMKLTSTPQYVPPTTAPTRSAPSADAAAGAAKADAPTVADAAADGELPAAPSASDIAAKSAASAQQPRRAKHAPGATVAGDAASGAVQVPESDADTAPDTAAPVDPSSNPFAPA